MQSRLNFIRRFIITAMINLLALISLSSYVYPAQDKIRQAEIRGVDMGGYGRIILNLNELPKTQIEIRNGILVWSFDHALNLRVDRLANEISRYIAGARLDPDGKIIRIALAQTLKYNLQDAGDDFYLDLLPMNWTAPNPPLPPDVVRDLSRRVRDAEKALRARDEAAETELLIESGENKSLSVLRFSPIDGKNVVLDQKPDSATIRILGKYRLDTQKLIDVLPKTAKLLSAHQEGDHFVIDLNLEHGIKLQMHEDDHVLSIELRKDKSGSEKIHGLNIQNAGDITASITSLDAQTTVEKLPGDANRLVLKDDEELPTFELSVPGKPPLVGFLNQNRLFLVFESELPVEIDNSVRSVHSPISSISAFGSGKMKSVMVTLNRDRFPNITATDKGYSIALSVTPKDSLQDVNYESVIDAHDQARMVVSLSDAARVFAFDDPETGENFLIAPSAFEKIGMREPHRFQEFEILPSAQGFALKTNVDDVSLVADAGALIITRPNGLQALTLNDDQHKSMSSSRSVIKAQNYIAGPIDEVLAETRLVTDRIIAAEPRERYTLRRKLARIYAAHELYKEAAITLDLALSEQVHNQVDPADDIERLLYRSLAGDVHDAVARLSARELTDYPDSSLLKAFALARMGQFQDAMTSYRASGSALASYPASMVRHILPPLAEAALESHDTPLAGNLVTALPPYVTDDMRDLYRYLSARFFDMTGQIKDALDIYTDLAISKDISVAVRARLRILALDESKTPDALALRIAAYQGLSTIWRGDWLEAHTVLELARLAFQSGNWRQGFIAMQKINVSFADQPGARALLDTATAQLEAIFDERAEHKIGPIEAVALFMDFREFMPVGRRGDDVIRKLVDKLVMLDLLPQAAELMRYQIQNRLEGPARANSAPRLAYIYLLDKRPKEALEILNETRMNGVSEETRRSRLLLEARARADLGDVDGAFEQVETLSGEDADRLRAEMAWRAHDWKKAADMSELVIGDQWHQSKAFEDDAALYALRAAIGYALADDKLSLDRIRGRFAKNFADRADAAAFQFLTTPTAKRSPFQSEYAASYKGGNRVDGFLQFYRSQYLKPATSENSANASPG